MMKNLLILFCFSFLFVGCSTYYGNVNYSEESSVYVKPSYRDSVQTADYISGSINTSIIENNNSYKNATFGNFSYNKGITKKNVNYAYGGFLYGGKINFTDDNLEKYNTEGPFNIPTETILEPEDFYYYGGGISGEIEYNIPFDWLDWRIIGLKASFSYEESEYADYRKQIVRKSNEVIDEFETEPFGASDEAINLNYDKLSINLSATSSLIFKMENSDVGFVNTMGLGYQGITASTCLYYSENRITGFISLHTAFQGLAFRTGIVYRLK